MATARIVEMRRKIYILMVSNVSLIGSEVPTSKSDWLQKYRKCRLGK
jgi:hypothetical protein